jgi:hypothetical protein
VGETVKVALVLATAVLPMLVAGKAHATDFGSLRAGGSTALVRGGGRYTASAGGSFEANIAPDVIGVRAGLDAVLGGWFEADSGHTFGLRPELGFYPGADDARFRLFGTLRWQSAIFGWGGAHGHVVEALELGPEIEWRHPGGSPFRFRLGAFFAPGRDAQGGFSWPGASLALTVELGWPTHPGVEVPEQCIELPTRPCPAR